MKQKLLSGLMVLTLALALAPAAWSQPDAVYENWGAVICPPEVPPTIDATNFINHGQFVVNITNFPPLLPSAGPVDPYQTYDTLNFSNHFGAFLACNSGFLLQFNPQEGVERPAASYYNAGTINCGTSDMVDLSYLTYRGPALYTNKSPANFTLNATNIVNPGVVNMGANSRLGFKGDTLDLTRGLITMEEEGTNTVYGALAYTGGIFDGYWGAGRATVNPATNFGVIPPFTFPHTVTNRYYQIFSQVLVASNALTYMQTNVTADGSNNFYRIVFLVNTNAGLKSEVFFPSNWSLPFFTDPETYPDIVLQWSAPATNRVGEVSTNYLYLFDSFAMAPEDQTDPPAPTRVWPPLAPAAGQTFVPVNFLPFNYIYQGFFTFDLNAYAFFMRQSPLDFGPPVPPTNNLPSGFFPNRPAAVSYSAYEGLFSAGSVVIADVAGQNITNLPGRIDLTANKTMDLTLAQISSVNSIVLKATNHFIGSEGARITTAYVDINLRSTNGSLAITNLIEPVIPHPGGVCDLCSIRWTNLIRVGENIYITNGYHMVFVNAKLTPRTSPLIQSLILRSTNSVTRDDSIVIHDFLTVSTNLLLDTRRLTIATNAPGAETGVGGIDIVNQNIVWSSATPRLQYLTNYGVLRALNAVFFGGSRTSPYYTSNYNEPYYVFVNRGAVTNFGSLIWATNFQNSGTFFASSGVIQLQQAREATLTGGAFLAPGNFINIESASLLVSNHVLQAGAALTLWVTNYLDDGSLSNSVDVITNRNIWNAGYGMNLPLLPPRASLLGTTITNTAAASVNTPNRWAGRDLGCQPGGFVNNAALGRLILDGATAASGFTFQCVNGTNALYVDQLEFRNATTNFSAGSLPETWNVRGVTLATNFTIYYGDAIVNGGSVARKLNGGYGVTDTNGGRFCWVSNFNTGFFSSTNVTYTDGSGTHRLNRALATDCEIDSNGNGLPNCIDPNPIPVLTPSTLILQALYTNLPARSVVLSWNTIPLASNYLYASSNLLLPATNWQLVTNFLSDATVGGRATVAYPLTTNGQRYYRVGVLSP